MDFKDIIREFQISIYGNIEQYNQTLSKGRCKIFYKYFNRNGTYITDEFAEKLISSLPYTPVKGIYEQYTEDFTDHGRKREEGRIYGIVPENPNFAWEEHLDEDGVLRTYACTDVLLFTALYKEAGEIMNKAQSMEIYEPSIKGEFKVIEGRKAFVFTDGCFLGLQVLGEDVEPCFEGAAFYTFYDNLKDILNKLENSNLFNKNTDGGISMDKLNFKLSDAQKHDAIWSLLNPNFNEENGWCIEYSICDIYDEYAIAFNYEACQYERIYYTKDDKEDSISINKKKKCYIVDVTEEEKTALNTIQALNGGTYEKIDENFGLNSEYEEKISEFGQKIEELEAANSTLQSEKEEQANEYAQAQESISALTEELNTLKDYKLNVETQEKQAVIEKYSKNLSEEKIAEYTAKIGEYTLTDLEKDLAFELVSSNPTIFSLEPQVQKVPKPEHRDGIEAILDKYVK